MEKEITKTQIEKDDIKKLFYFYLNYSDYVQSKPTVSYFLF